MGLRFQKRIRIFKGLTINLSKTGASVSLGGRGATVNISKRGTKTTIGMPGTGISYSSFHKNNENDSHAAQESVHELEVHQEMDVPERSASWSVIFVIFILLLIGYLIGKIF